MSTDIALLLTPDTAIRCPKCGHDFSLEQGFARKALESLEITSRETLVSARAQERVLAEQQARERQDAHDRASQAQIQELKALLDAQSVAHAKSFAEMQAMTAKTFAPQIEALQKTIADQSKQLATLDRREAELKDRERSLESRIADAAASRAAELVAGERQVYEKRLAEQQSQVQTLMAEQLSLRQERQKLVDEKAALALEVRKQVDAQLGERELLVRTQEKERADLDKAELQKKLSDALQQLNDTQRKLEQGSQQLQGEVLELAIEEGLRRECPYDFIEEVKKGARGGDVIQRVMTRGQQPAGVILWETKRAKDFSAPWLQKLKDDMRASQADVGVLVTMPTAVPREWAIGQQFGLVEDVWVCTWGMALQLAAVLRASILDVHKQRVVSAGKGEKMEAVYDYVTSPQFAQKLRAVFEVFQTQKKELDAEKNQTTQRWARREKQLEAGAQTLLGIGGEVQGLSQLSLPSLELQNDDAAGEDT